MSKPRKPSPWPRMAKLAFSVGPQGGALTGDAKAEFETLARQADAGYARTGRRKRSTRAIAADAHRAFILPLITPEFRRTKKAIGELGKQLAERFGGTWSHYRTEQLVKSLKRQPPRPPRPYTEPNDVEDSGDEYM